MCVLNIFFFIAKQFLFIRPFFTLCYVVKRIFCLFLRNYRIFLQQNIYSGTNESIMRTAPTKYDQWPSRTIYLIICFSLTFQNILVIQNIPVISPLSIGEYWLFPNSSRSNWNIQRFRKQTFSLFFDYSLSLLRVFALASSSEFHFRFPIRYQLHFISSFYLSWTISYKF